MLATSCSNDGITKDIDYLYILGSTLTEKSFDIQTGSLKFHSEPCLDSKASRTWVFLEYSKYYLNL